MQAATFAAVPTSAMICLRQDHQSLSIVVEILAFFQHKKSYRQIPV
jgi:hypothetical protein